MLLDAGQNPIVSCARVSTARQAAVAWVSKRNARQLRTSPPTKASRSRAGFNEIETGEGADRRR